MIFLQESSSEGAKQYKAFTFLWCVGGTIVSILFFVSPNVFLPSLPSSCSCSYDGFHIVLYVMFVDFPFPSCVCRPVLTIAQTPAPLDQRITILVVDSVKDVCTGILPVAGCSAGVVNLSALPTTLTREVGFHILCGGCHVDMVMLINEYSDSSCNCRRSHLETVIYSEYYIFLPWKLCL